MMYLPATRCWNYVQANRTEQGIGGTNLVLLAFRSSSCLFKMRNIHLLGNAMSVATTCRAVGNDVEAYYVQISVVISQ